MEQRGRRHVKRNKSTMWSIQMQELRTTMTGCKYIKQISENKDEWKDAYGENIKLFVLSNQHLRQESYQSEKILDLSHYSETDKEKVLKLLGKEQQTRKRCDLSPKEHMPIYEFTLHAVFNPISKRRQKNWKRYRILRGQSKVWENLLYKGIKQISLPFEEKAKGEEQW